jgi:cell division protein FtsZ
VPPTAVAEDEASAEWTPEPSLVSVPPIDRSFDDDNDDDLDIPDFLK